MENKNINLDKFTHEAHEYFNQLADDLGHPHERHRVVIVWRAVMHTLRDRIQISESFDLMSQLPLILKGMYVEAWKYHDKPPLEYDTIEEMKEEIKRHQRAYGELEFNWGKSTEEIASIVLDSMKRYFSEGQMDHLRGQLSKEVQTLVH